MLDRNNFTVFYAVTARNVTVVTAVTVKSNEKNTIFVTTVTRKVQLSRKAYQPSFFFHFSEFGIVLLFLVATIETPFCTSVRRQRSRISRNEIGSVWIPPAFDVVMRFLAFRTCGGHDVKQNRIVFMRLSMSEGK